MSVATLRFNPWQAKRQLPPAKYASLTVAVSKVLFHTVSQRSDDRLDVAWARAFIRSYAQDTARHTLQVLDGEEQSPDYNRLSSQELSIRTLALQLAGRLAKVRGGLDVPALVDLAVTYGSRNATSLRTIFDDACTSTPSLLEEFKTDVVSAFKAFLESTDIKTTVSARNRAHVMSLLLHCACPQIVVLFAEDREVVLTLVKFYQVGLEKVATSRGGVRLDPTHEVAAWQKDWLFTKAGLLDAFHTIIQTLLLSKSGDNLFDMLFAILELPSSSDSLPSVPFISLSLLADYQYAFSLSNILTERFRGTDDARVDLLAATLAGLAPSSPGPKSAGGLSVLVKDKGGPSVQITPPASDSKGKAKAVEPELESETALDLAVSQVVDIFPTHTPQYLRRCLKHPTFGGDPEKLISALLEEAMPPELIEGMDSGTEQVAQKQEYEFIKDRRNAWDEDAMDFSRLRIGKTRENADALLQDRSFVEQMKADIIRRAEELSDEEDEAARQPGARTVAFEEELDDDVDSLVDQSVKVIGDGEESDDESDTADVAAQKVETILELTYIDDPKVFDRDGATRRSKARAGLKVRTGWADEQIEGWRIMLERNPKKDKILQKHEFAGNVPLVPSTNTNEPEPSGSSRGGLQRGNGSDARGRGRGRGSGRGGGGGGDTTRGRAFKDKNKARTGNHDRKRGHDKKMARGGGGPPI